MSKIEDLKVPVNAEINHWESLDDDDIGDKATDRFEYLEIVMADLVEVWYQKTKVIIRNRGTHGLGVMKESFKTQVQTAVNSLRENESNLGKLSDDDFQFNIDISKALIIHNAGKLWKYAESIMRRKKCQH